MKRSIHIVCQLNGSLNEIVEDLTPFLEKEFIVTRESESMPIEKDLLLCHYLIPSVVQDPSFNLFKKKVLILPLDGTSIKEEYINMINQFDMIITPSSSGKKILEENNITKPIAIIPNYYCNIVPENKKFSFYKNKIVFYHESTLIERKGFDLMCEAFIRAFSDTPEHNKVLLVIKGPRLRTVTFDEIEAKKRSCMSLQKKYKAPASIIKISQFLSKETLQALLSQAHSYVSFSKIEGFGIPLLRAAVLEKPILTLDSKFSGYTDFLTNQNSYLIPTNTILVHKRESSLWKEDSVWSYPKMDQAVEMFRILYKDIKNCQAKHPNSTELRHMSINNVAINYIEVLKKV